MEQKRPDSQIYDLDDAGFRDRVARFDETTDGILADIEREHSLKQPFTTEEKRKIMKPLYEVKTPEDEQSEKDEYGNYIIEEPGPLAPPIPKKSTPEGRATLETLTSRRSNNVQK